MDPLANHELQIDKSPYAYGWNNPIKYIDPNGLCPNGCSEGEKTKDFYPDGAVVQNKYGAFQYKDGKWNTISMTPDGSGENTSTDESGGGGNESGGSGSSDGNGFFGSSGWGDMMGKVDVGVGAFGVSNTVKTEIIDYAVRNNFKSATTRKEFYSLSEKQKSWRENRALGKFGTKYLNAFKLLGRATGYTSAAISVYDFVENPTIGSFTKASVNVSLAFLRTNPVVGVTMGVMDITGVSDSIYGKIDNMYK